MDAGDQNSGLHALATSTWSIVPFLKSPHLILLILKNENFQSICLLVSIQLNIYFFKKWKDISSFTNSTYIYQIH